MCELNFILYRSDSSIMSDNSRSRYQISNSLRNRMLNSYSSGAIVTSSRLARIELQ